MIQEILKSERHSNKQYLLSNKLVSQIHFHSTLAFYSCAIKCDHLQIYTQRKFVQLYEAIKGLRASNSTSTISGEGSGKNCVLYLWPAATLLLCYLFSISLCANELLA